MPFECDTRYTYYHYPNNSLTIVFEIAPEDIKFKLDTYMPPLYEKLGVIQNQFDLG